MSLPPLAKAFPAVAVVALFLFAGCLGAEEVPRPAAGGDGTGSDGGDGPTGPAPSPTFGPGSGNGSAPPSAGNGTGNGTGAPGNGTGGNETGGNETNGTDMPPHEWPALSSATVRPGMKLYIDRAEENDGYCTANFVFRSRTNGTIYIGTAAHCMGQEVGARIHHPPDDTYATGARGGYIGKVVYSSYKELGVVEQGTAHTEINDFALIEVDAAVIDKVHPAMIHYGGPTALAKAEDIRPLAKLIYFGNSALRPGPQQLDYHEGFVRTVDAPWQFTGYTVVPGIPGDSGSGVLLGDGKAAGINVFVGLLPYPGESGSTILHTALEYAKTRGWDVELQTWELLDDGVTP